MLNKPTKKLSEQTTTGGAVVNAGGHVDLALGMFDRPGPQKDKNFLPVVPGEMVATQLATNRPPVDDEDYVPTSKNELSISVSEISKTVPDSQIHLFYRRVKDLAQRCIDKEEVEVIKKEDDMLESKDMIARNKLSKMIEQALGQYSRGMANLSSGTPEKNYRALAAAPGIPGVSDEPDPVKRYGAVRYSDKLGRAQLGRMLELVPVRDLDRIWKYATSEYIDLLLAGDYISEEDASDLRANQKLVEELDSFNFFIRAAFFGPAIKAKEKNEEASENLGKRIYNKYVLRKDKGGKYEIDGLPVNTYAKIATGQTFRNKTLAQKKEIIWSQFEEIIRRGKVDPELAKEQYQILVSNLAADTELAMGKQESRDEDPLTNPREVLKKSVELYNKTSEPQKMQLLKQALDATKAAAKTGSVPWRTEKTYSVEDETEVATGAECETCDGEGFTPDGKTCKACSGTGEV